MDIVQTFYDNMASQYDKLFSDWHASTREQAIILQKLFEECGFDKNASVLEYFSLNTGIASNTKNNNANNTIDIEGDRNNIKYPNNNGRIKNKRFNFLYPGIKAHNSNPPITKINATNK